jgi:hypothetical protein
LSIIELSILQKLEAKPTSRETKPAQKKPLGAKNHNKYQKNTNSAIHEEIGAKYCILKFC